MPESVLAATTIGAFKTEIREYPFRKYPPSPVSSRSKPPACAAAIGKPTSRTIRRVLWAMRTSAGSIESDQSRPAAPARYGTEPLR